MTSVPLSFREQKMDWLRVAFDSIEQFMRKAFMCRALNPDVAVFEGAAEPVPAVGAYPSPIAAIDMALGFEDRV